MASKWFDYLKKDFVQGFPAFCGFEVVRVDAERNLLLVKGAVPGSKGGDVIIRPAVKAR